MDTKKLIENTFGAVLALTITTFVVVFIAYGCSGVGDRLKETLTITIGFFGGFATLAAAYIAANLFNDWREQHNKQVLADEAKDTFHLFHKQRDVLHSLKYICQNIMEEKEVTHHSWNGIAKKYEEKFLPLYNSDKDKMSSFCYLSKGQLVYDLTMDYWMEINNFSNYLSDKRNMPFSDTTFLNKDSSLELFNILKNVEDKNSKILNELKTYIFVLR